MTTHPSSATITTVAAITFANGATIRAEALADFFAGVPSNAHVDIKETRGDPRDPREAGFHTVTVTAKWNGKP